MAFSSFSAFVDTLDRAGELKRVSIPVATELEITEWADREMKAPGGGKALLFEKPTVNGVVSSIPLAINTLGSKKRMAMSLGLENIEQLAEEMRLLVKAKPPTSLKSAWKLAMQGLSLLNAKPKHVSDGPCTERRR
jgi:4-hydroxy-3-polyprenylbenzoate decarboxylase